MVKNLKNLEARHHMIKRLRARGDSNKVIAEKVGLSEKTIHSITSQPLFKKALKDFTARLDQEVIEQVGKEIVDDPVKGIFEGAKVQAAEDIVSLGHNAESEAIKHKASIDILAFAGYKPKETGGQQTTIFIGDKQAIVLNDALNDITI